MKLSFKKLPSASNGKVQVSLDGGNTFEEHDVQSIKSTGIPLSDGQDYSKIRIKGNTELLKSLDVISKVSVLEHEEPEQEYYDPQYYAWGDGNVIYYTENDESYSGDVFGKVHDVNFLPAFMDKEHEAHIFDGHLIISELGGKSQTFDRLPEKDFGKKPKNKPLYVYDTRLPSRTYIELNDPLAVDDAGDRIDSLIINYDYIAKILGITNGKRIYFNLHHSVTVPAVPAEQDAILRSYFIDPCDVKFVEVHYNINDQNELDLVIEYYPGAPSEPNEDIKIFHVNPRTGEELHGLMIEPAQR